MRRKILALAVLPLLLAGCKSSEQTSSSEPVNTSSAEVETGPIIKEKTTIELWSITGQNNQAQLQSYVDEFMRKEPNVTVINKIQTGMGYNELKSAVVDGFPTNNYPDIVQCYPDHVAEYIDYGKAVNLDPYIENKEYGWTDEDKSDLIDTFIQEGKEYTVEGTYSVPYCKSTEAMYYNKEVLVGLDLSAYDPTINDGNALSTSYLENLTWEELFGKLCPAIIAKNDDLPTNQKILKNDDKHHAVFAYDSDDNLFITLAEQYGIGYTSVDKATGKGRFNFGEGKDKEDMIELLTKWRGYAEKGYIISKGSAENNYTNAYFNTQNVLFSVGSTGGYKYQFADSNPMDVGVAPIPHAEGKDLHIINQGPSLTILEHGDENRKLASWLLYTTITNKDNALDWAINSGYMGIRKSVRDDEEFQAASSERGQTVKTIDMLLARNLSYCIRQDVLDSLFVSPAFVGSSTARTQVAGIMTKVLTPSSGDISGIDGWFTEAYNQCLLALK
jgi:multiple sugar transport system substrate-binding protein